jgi:hypothetical protein
MFFVPLFFLELVNKESALFISLWLVIDSIDIRLKSIGARIRISNTKWFQLAVGCMIGIGGAVYTKLVRDALFIKSSIPWVGEDAENKLLGNQMNLFNSASEFVRNFAHPNFRLDLLINVFYFWLIWYVWDNRKAVLKEDLRWKVLVIVGAVICSAWTFGFFNEIRQIAVIIPFLLMLNLSLRNKILA